MRLDSVRELKASLTSLFDSPILRKAASASSMTSLRANIPSFALGIAPRKKRDYALAVRLQVRGLELIQPLEEIVKRYKGETDVRYIGRIDTFGDRVRPLRIGCSVGHCEGGTGTLGAFVRDSPGGAVMILSNNHVLAKENRAKAGDAIIQPGSFDGGADPDDRVATLTRWVHLNRTKSNRCDAAAASLDDGIEYEPCKLAGLTYELKGSVDVSELDEKSVVAKVGRTTGTTQGRITAFELDHVQAYFGTSLLTFDDQIEVEGSDSGPFSRPGDSGSLIVDPSGRAVALLFAGSDQGGSNGQGLAYANPIAVVLEELKVDLHLG